MLVLPRASSSDAEIVVKGETALTLYSEMLGKVSKEQATYVAELLAKKKKRNEAKSR